MKILHFADRHGRDKDADEIEKCDAFIVETARQEKPDLIVNAGDTFDSADVKMGSRSALQAIAFHAALAGIAPVVVIKGTPSHDGNAPEILRYVCGFNGIVVADRPVQVMLCGGNLTEMVGKTDPYKSIAADPDAIITLIPTPTKQYFQTTAGIEGSDQEIGQTMSALFAGFGASAAEYPGVPNILAYHGCVSGGQASNGQVMTGRDVTVSRDQMAMSGADLILCGHLHLPQELPGSIFYSGSIYANNIGEDHKHGFYIHIAKSGIAADEDRERIHVVSGYIETPCKRTVRMQHDFTENGVPSDLLSLIAPTQDITGAHIRLELQVWQDEAGMIDRKAIETAIMGAAASCDIRINAVPREAIRAAAVLEAETLRDEFSEMAKLRGETLDPEILVMAEKLENVPGEELLKEVAA